MRSSIGALSVALGILAFASAPARSQADKLLHDVDVGWDDALIGGAVAELRVRLRGARTLLESVPIEGEVDASLVLPAIPGAKGKPPERREKVWPLAKARTDRNGYARVRFRVPRVDPGEYELRLDTRSAHGQRSLKHAVGVGDRTVLNLRTDRTIYKPGQTILWRATLANGSDAHPAPNRRVEVTVHDPRGTRVWRGDLRTDRGGMVSGRLPLADDLITGDYQVSAYSGRDRADLEVEVRPFEMPAFFVRLDVSTQHPQPGSTVDVEVVARYPYGEPVRGAVHAVAVEQGRRMSLVDREAKTGEDGRYAFQVKLPPSRSGTVNVAARVRDGAGRERSASVPLSWGPPELKLFAIPETSSLRPGVTQFITVVTTDGTGKLVPATIDVAIDAANHRSSHPSPGAIRVPVVIPESQQRASTRPHSELVRWDAQGVSMSSTDELEKDLERYLRNMELHPCLAVERDHPMLLSIRASWGKNDWRIDDVAYLPFPERPSFRVPLTPRQTSCVAGRFGSALLLARNTDDARFEIVARLSRVPTSEQASIGWAQVIVRATTGDGRIAEAERSVSVDNHRAPRIVRLREAVVRAGEPVRVVATWPQTDFPVTATLMRGDSPLATAPCAVNGKGELEAELVPPEGTFGLMEVRLSELGWPAPRLEARAVSEAASVFIRPERLAVEVELPERVRPGEQLKLGVRVADARGEPRPEVALAVSVVDERVLAISERQTTLVETLTADDVKRASEVGLAFGELLRRESLTDPERLVMRAILQALPVQSEAPRPEISALERFRTERKRALKMHADVVPVLAARGGAVVKPSGAGGWEVVHPLAGALVEAGWKVVDTLTPWEVPLDYAYLATLLPSANANALALETTRWRLERLVKHMRKRKRSAIRGFRKGKAESLAAWLGDKRANLGEDAWGRPFVIRPGQPEFGMSVLSVGPDGKEHTDDDLVERDVLGEASHRWLSGVGMARSVSRSMGYASHAARAIKMGSATTRPVVHAIRKRFDETVLWSVGELTNRDGRATFPLDMADSVTGWTIEVEALGARGGFGAKLARTETFLPLHVDLGLPHRLTVGDRYTATAVVANHEAADLELQVEARASDGLALTGTPARTLTLPAGETRALSLPLLADAPGSGRVELRLLDPKGAVKDAMRKEIAVVARGLEERRVIAAFVQNGQTDMSLEVPPDLAPGTLNGRVRIFRGAADQALDGLEGMLREPYGCFEQTSSSTWPNLLVLRLLKGGKGTGAARQRARELVARGYQRLLRFEVRGGGFSWFGERPANTVLTAYGLVEFVDMAKVYPVDPALIRRTRRWLVSRQRADGSWASERHWRGGRLATTAYITWALAESGDAAKAVARGLRFLRRNRGKLASRPYLLALWAGAVAASGRDSETAVAALDKSAAAGGAFSRYFKADGPTLFWGSGRSADIEVTALAAGAMLAGDEANGPLAAEPAMRWLWQARHPRYGWGTTQATVLALRAAAAREAGSAAPREGLVRVLIDDREVGRADLAGAGVPTVDLPRDLAPGAHALRIESDVPTALNVDVRQVWQRSEEPRAVSQGLEVVLAIPQPRVGLGDAAVVRVGVRNPADEAVAMPTVVVPIPPGFRADPRSLEKVVERTAVTRFEDRGDALNFYLERLGPGGAVAFHYSLVATAECDVMQRPAQAYAYYSPELRGSSEPSRLSVRRN